MAGLRAFGRRSISIQIVLLMLAVFVGGFALGSQHSVGRAQSDTVPPRGAEETFGAFWQVYNMIQAEYISPVDNNLLVNGAINGMIEALDDPFSGYMDPEIYPLMNDDLDGEVEGIGAVVETVEDTGEIRIVSVLEGSPAETAGIESGDVFIEVDGENVIGLTQMELVVKVRGRAGTAVDLTMRRGEELIEFRIVRARIEIPNVEWEVLEGGVGYVRLRDFSGDALNKLNEALEAINVNELNGLVLDLRGNPGGLLTSAIDIASAFIKDGVILIEDFGDGTEQIFNANGSYIGVSVPLVVLVDENSASASELVAGALQDQGRATIIGEVTFGKGTVQTWRELVNGGGVRLTIARWLTPNRNWIHDQGVTPDIIVEWDPTNPDEARDPQLDAAIDFLLQPDAQNAQ